MRPLSIKHLEGIVFEGEWNSKRAAEKFSITIGTIDEGRFSGLLDDQYGSHPIRGAVSYGFISFRKFEGEFGGVKAYACYQGTINEENDRCSIEGGWVFTGSEGVEGKFSLKEQYLEQ